MGKRRRGRDKFVWDNLVLPITLLWFEPHYTFVVLLSSAYYEPHYTVVVLLSSAYYEPHYTFVSLGLKLMTLECLDAAIIIISAGEPWVARVC